jgi:hypothetical protein
MQVDLSEREIVVLRVALMQKMSRLNTDIVDNSPNSIHNAEMNNELRDVIVKLGELRHAR